MAQTGDGEGFKVTDRRRAGRGEPDAPAGKESTSEAAGAGEAPKPSAAAESETVREVPPIDFATFLLSLASTALIHLGVNPDPVGGKTEIDPVLARQTIDILGMLREKTRGNLSDDEQHFFDALLYDLRMRYVEIAGRQ